MLYIYIKKNSILIENETVKNKVSERLKSPKFSKFSHVKFLPKSEKAMMDDEKQPTECEIDTFHGWVTTTL